MYSPVIAHAMVTTAPVAKIARPEIGFARGRAGGLVAFHVSGVPKKAKSYSMIGFHPLTYG